MADFPVDRAVSEGRVPDRAPEGVPELHEVDCPPELREQIETLMAKEKIDAIVERTKQAGGEVVGLLKTGSAFVSPAISALEMAESFLKDKKRVLACACLCEGEFGVDGLYVGVPCVIGADGLERIIEVELNAEEQKNFDASVDHVRTLVSQIEL